RLLWRYEWKTAHNLNVATPIYADGQVFISSNYGNGGAVFRLKKEGNPEKVWKTLAMQNHFSTSVLLNGHLYGFSNTRLRFVDFATRKAVWDKAALGKGSLLIADGQLLLLGEHGDLVLADATPKGYVEKSRCKPLEGPALTVPVLAGGRLYVRNEKVLLALDVKEQGKKPAE